ncbi:hypothetical protein [Amycolatopsis sp. cmx-11-51]|uniref:hypothetical protein n=1 Tax=unclassified Amycolatopsis TaxID=2618356 RepID=UPI0039E29DCB
MEELAFGMALACFAAVCVAIAPERPAPVATTAEFYRAVNRVCVQAGKDSGVRRELYWPDPRGDVAVERRKWEHYVAMKVDGAREVFKGATGVRTSRGDAVSAREDFLAAVRHYLEAGERFQGNGARSPALMDASDSARDVVRDLAQRHEAYACVILT